MTNATETWRVIESHPNYDVSNLGHIRSKQTGKPIAKQTRPNGTNEALLYADKIQSRLSVAKLVWNAFNEPVGKYARIEHINGDPGDDRLVNLKLKETKEKSMNLTKEEFAAKLGAARTKKETPEEPGSIAAEIEKDLKRAKAVLNQLPVKETPETPIERKAPVSGPLSGRLCGRIEDVIQVLHGMGVYGVKVDVFFDQNN